MKIWNLKRGDRHNNYAYALTTEFFIKIPKAVLAAIAVSYASRLGEGDNFEDAQNEIHYEWGALYQTGIVPQRPPKGTPLHSPSET